jgi:hypothetical protein
VSSINQELADGLEETVRDLTRRIKDSGFDPKDLQDAFTRIGSLPIISDEDRRVVLLSYLTLLDTAIKLVPEEAAGPLRENRASCERTYLRLFGSPDTLYLSASRIVQRLAEQLRQNLEDDELEQAALAEASDLPFQGDEEEQSIAVGTTLKILGLGAARQWLRQGGAQADPATPIARVVHDTWASMQSDGLDVPSVLAAAKQIAGLQPPDDGGSEAVRAGLFQLLGLGLLCQPDAGPGLEPIRDGLMELVADSIEPTPAAPTSSFAHKVEAILAEYGDLLESEGFSEYRMQEAMNKIKALPAETAEDHQTIVDSLVQLIDLTLPKAAQNVADALKIVRAQLVDLDNGDAPSILSADELREACTRLRDETRAKLEGGAAVEPIIIAAALELGKLGRHLAERDDEGLQVLFQSMFVDFINVLRPYIPEGLEHTWQDVAGMASAFPGAVEVAAGDDPVQEFIWTSQMGEHTGRLTRTATGLNLPEELADVDHLRQFMALFTSFGDRFFDPALWSHLKGKDAEEYERMSERLKAALGELRFATTEEQFLHHQRGSLRRVAMEFRMFQRRRSAMLAFPDYPTPRVTPDANAVFFSGTPSVEEIVQSACGVIGMTLAPLENAGTRTERRWQQLRAAGVAVFDYSAYDPAPLESAEAIANPATVEAAILKQAGELATVAFETGWAYVLGHPMVVVTRQGAPAPFDVDVESVVLQSSEADCDRVLAGLQAAVYGVQRGVMEGGLRETVSYAKRCFGDSDDPGVRALLQSMDDISDATRVRLALASALDLLPGRRPLLVLPAFPPGSPPADHRHLFHVTGFRDWATVCQEETREACERAGIEYRIGYESLDSQILQAVWSDVCGAAFVVADITNLNPNAALELGIALALGRPTLILTRNRNVFGCFPPVEKLRTHLYDPVERRAEMAALIDGFLAGAGNHQGC